jgi:tryptophan synthase alpha subunit
VVGSALVSAMEGSADAEQAAMRAATFLRPLRTALDGPAD